MIHQINKTILFILFILSQSTVSAYYSKEYIPEMVNIILTDPVKAQEESLQMIAQAKKQGNVENQLIAYLYLSKATKLLSDTKKAREYTQIALKLAEESNNIGMQVEFLIELSDIQELNGELKLALKNSNLALKKANITQDERLIAASYSIRSQVEVSLGLLDLSLNDIEKSLELIKKNNDSSQLNATYNLIAVIYGQIGDYDNALKYLFESLEIDLIQSSYDLSAIYYNIASIYADKLDYNNAEIYFEKSKKYSEQIKDYYGIAYTNFGMANLYFKKNEIDKAKMYLNKTFTNFEENNDDLMLLNSQSLMVDILLKKQEYKGIEPLFNKIEIIVNKLNIADAKLNFLKQKSNYFGTQQQWQKAFELQKKVEKHIVEEFAKEKEQAIAEAKNRIDLKFNQEKITLLEKQNELQKHSINNSKTKQKYLFLLVALILTILLLTTIAYNKQKTLKSQLFKLSHTDSLTNVSNRRSIMQELEKQFERSESDKSQFSLITIDLDLFKNINDTFGHSTGNEVLKHFANTAKNIFKNRGQVGRIGGEEWLIIVPNISQKNTQDCLKKLREQYTREFCITVHFSLKQLQISF